MQPLSLPQPMQYMSHVAAPAEPDLIDLRFLPSWVKQEAPQYSDFEGEEAPTPEFRGPRERAGRDDRRRDKPRPRRDRRERRPEQQREQRESRPLPSRTQSPPPASLPQLEIRFLPHPAAFENVAAQIKSGTAAYSLYALARLFLQKPERYDVQVTAMAEQPFYRLSESRIIATDRAALESSAFRALRNDFYETEVTLSEPVKGNFTSVARERSSGALLGPTNHHAYQPQLRRLYEQRFSRRMSFPDFQRQIEIVTDPALVEQWKEEARKTTKFTARKEEPPLTFSSENEAERHFREKYLPGLVVETREAEIDGRTSRVLRDRAIAHVIENAWSMEERSPSKMMQELAGRFRGAGLHIFRHRKGMLFVSPIRPKAIDEAAVSDFVRAILDTLKATPRINRKDLAEKLIPAEAANEDAKMRLVSDLHWLVREGHVLEFNDGALDLPRVKSPAQAAMKQDEAGEQASVAAPAAAEETERSAGGEASAVNAEKADAVTAEEANSRSRLAGDAIIPTALEESRGEPGN